MKELQRENCMNTNEKQEFFDVLTKTADLYSKKIERARVSVYWEALKHRDLTDVRLAINKHVQDAERGRFFPLPADVSAQLPAERDPWPDAEIAWARCPKDEISSSAMCDEVAGAYGVARELMLTGDMVAARMAFKAEYKRRVTDAKDAGRLPTWWASLGSDQHEHDAARSQVVEMKNLALPPSEQIALPSHQEATVSLEHLVEESAIRAGNPELAKTALAKIKENMGIKS